MAGFRHIFVFLLLTVSYEGTFSLPFEKGSSTEIGNRRFHVFIPRETNARQRRAEEEQSGNSGVQELITTAIKDGIAASSAVDSPTMFVGGFSVMMQPMPNGTEFAGQMMQMAPHYMGLIPGLGRK